MNNKENVQLLARNIIQKVRSSQEIKKYTSLGL